MDNFGVSFAPTPDNAAMGARNGQLSGVPQAVQVLSLALPRVIGAKPVAPTELLNGAGAPGIDPAASAVLNSIIKLLHGISNPLPGGPTSGGTLPPNGGLPGGTAGPNQPFPPPPPMPRPAPTPGIPPIGQPPADGTPAPTPFTPKPRIITQDDPLGGAPPAPRPSPFRQTPAVPAGRFQR